jgi:hypothetical protein
LRCDVEDIAIASKTDEVFIYKYDTIQFAQDPMLLLLLLLLLLLGLTRGTFVVRADHVSGDRRYQASHRRSIIVIDWPEMDGRKCHSVHLRPRFATKRGRGDKFL